PLKRVTVSAKLINLDGSEKGTAGGVLDLDPDSSTKAFDLPKPADLSRTYFLKLELRDSSSRLLSDNFYWLSAKLDTLDWAARKDTVYTPQKDFADLTGLNDLPAVKLDAKAELVAGVAGQDTQQQVHITVKNPSKSVAFMVHLRATHGPDGGDITP